MLGMLLAFHRPTERANTLDVFSDRQSAKRLLTRQKWLFYALRSFFGTVKTTLETLSTNPMCEKLSSKTGY